MQVEQITDSVLQTVQVCKDEEVDGRMEGGNTSQHQVLHTFGTAHHCWLEMTKEKRL